MFDQLKGLMVIIAIFAGGPALIGWLLTFTGLTSSFWWPAGITFAVFVVAALIAGWWLSHNFRV